VESFAPESTPVVEVAKAYAGKVMDNALQVPRTETKMTGRRTAVTYQPGYYDSHGNMTPDKANPYNT